MKPFKLMIASVFLMLLAVSSVSHAQTGETKTIPPLDNDALEQWGGEEGIRNWVESLFYYIMLDNRINHVFREFGNIERQIFLNTQLEQLVLGGDVEYQGASMAAAHADLGITLTQFNAVVEAAYNACERVNVTYEACNQLIAALAPYERVIVTR
ncbi:group 1 truncated hemoglobin [Spongiibacter nanhainus]|uniref:Group 1 truncated hemoglobin n=1 Tax=Spongiibacter nanhainus TaxID=2794344 RepID=A0A7T4UQU6_9GAMM|nr:group 1 truncated hemoglobin [Spongiibacter nanhainus]QQD18877.1 group 1 truncated hemoglobin [Spongiibacter nanhainus]